MVVTSGNRLSARSALITGIVGLLVIAAVAASFIFGTMRASAQSNQNGSAAHTQQIVNTYLHIMDQGMSTSQCDFSQLSTVYASNATLTLTGGPFAPGGPFGGGGAYGEQQFHGVTAIIGAYSKLCHALYAKGLSAPAWTQDTGVALEPNVLNSYEHVSASDHLLGRCMHVFTVQGDRITRLDWSVYA